jgi:hypothetical protein
MEVFKTTGGGGKCTGEWVLMFLAKVAFNAVKVLDFNERVHSPKIFQQRMPCCSM